MFSVSVCNVLARPYLIRIQSNNDFFISTDSRVRDWSVIGLCMAL